MAGSKMLNVLENIFCRKTFLYINGDPHTKYNQWLSDELANNMPITYLTTSLDLAH